MSALLLVAGVLFGVAPAGAQRGSAEQAGQELARIDSLIDRDALDEARGRLAEWNATHPAGAATVSGDARARALILAGRLATTWAGAEEAYIAVALGYPISAAAPEAMLRLGQGLLASGRPREGAPRAIAYLERLINDYPNSTFRTQGYLWLARAHDIMGRTATACTTLRKAAGLPADSVLEGIIAADFARVCGGQGRSSRSDLVAEARRRR